MYICIYIYIYVYMCVFFIYPFYPAPFLRFQRFFSVPSCLKTRPEAWNRSRNKSSLPTVSELPAQGCACHSLCLKFSNLTHLF